MGQCLMAARKMTHLHKKFNRKHEAFRNFLDADKR